MSKSTVNEMLRKRNQLYRKNGRERRGYLSADNMHGNDVGAGTPLCVLRARVRLAPEAERKTAFRRSG
jgi:hypothetical protein